MKQAAETLRAAHVKPLRDLTDRQGCLAAQSRRQRHLGRVLLGPLFELRFLKGVTQPLSDSSILPWLPSLPSVQKKLNRRAPGSSAHTFAGLPANPN